MKKKTLTEVYRVLITEMNNTPPPPTHPRFGTTDLAHKIVVKHFKVFGSNVRKCGKVQQV